MIQLALIGVGKWGQRYIETIERLKNCKLTYICSPNIQEKKYISNNYVKFNDYKKLSKCSGIDGIIIATPAKTHFSIATYFLKKNCNLLIEKPLTLSYQEALKLYVTFKQNKSIVLTGNTYEYHGGIQKLVKQLDSIGKPYYIEIEAIKNIRQKHDSMAPALWEWVPHDINICYTLLNEYPIAVSAWSFGKQNTQDMVMLRLFFKGKCQVFIKVGWIFSTKKSRVSVFGQKGFLLLDDIAQKIYYESSVTDTTRVYQFQAEKSSLELQLNAFLEAIETKIQPKTDINEGLMVVKVLHFAQKSLQQKGKLINII